MLTRALCSLLVIVATAQADVGPPPTPPPPPPPAPNVVAPTVLEALRVAGEKNIVPDDVTKTEMSRAGKDKVVTAYKLCIKVDGAIASVSKLKSSGFGAYDTKIMGTIQGSWRYKPFMLNGKAAPVCTAVTFIYSQVPADSDAPSVKLVKAGKAPMRELHLAAQKGSKRTVVITSQDTRARGAKGKLGPPEPQPRSQLEIESEVVEVAPNGDAGFDVTYKKIEIIPVKPDAATKAANVELAKLAGTKAHVVLTQDGRAKDFKIDPTPNASPQIRQALEATSGLVPQLAEELPDGQVGVGAVWESVRTVTAGEMTITITTTREIVAIDGAKITMHVTLTEDGKGSGTGNLTSHGVGKGDVVIDLANMLPIKASMEMQQDTELDSDGTRLAQHNVTTTTVTSR